MRHTTYDLVNGIMIPRFVGTENAWWQTSTDDPSMAQHVVLETITPDDIDEHVGFGSIEHSPISAIGAADVRTFGINAALDSVGADGAADPAALVDTIADYVDSGVSDSLYMTTRRVPETGQKVVIGAGMSPDYGLTMHALPELADKYRDAIAEVEAEHRGARLVGDPHIVSAGLLFDRGSTGFVSILVGMMIIDPNGINDHIRRYLSVTDAADMTARLRFIDSWVRIVCHNTQVAAENSADEEFSASLRHGRRIAANVASTFVDMAKGSVGQAARYALECERMLARPISDQAWDVAMSKLAPSAWGADGPRANVSKLQSQRAVGLLAELRNLADEDPTNYAATGENLYGLEQVLTGYVRNHAEPVTRQVAQLRTDGAPITDADVAEWRNADADLMVTTGMRNTVADRFYAAAAAVRSFALTN